ncbi:hypothetical protein BH11ACT3_BH11ACT3_20030 [soil metagenome]
MIDDAEYQRVRRAAYSRGATAADLAALAGLQSPPPETDENPDDDAAAAVEQPGTTPAPQQGAAPRRRRRVLVGVVALALVMGAAAGWVLKAASPAAPASAPSSLDVFEEPPGVNDATTIFAQLGEVPDSRSIFVTDVRFLDEIDGRSVYGAMGVQLSAVSQSTPVVCLGASFAVGSSQVSCTPLETFARQGVRLSSGSGAAAFFYQWGPRGGVESQEHSLGSYTT